jgi:hypothetical protein
MYLTSLSLRVFTTTTGARSAPKRESKNMTGKELAQTLGKTALLSVDGFSFPVTINNFKTSYGTDRFEVEPVGGSGLAWVNADRVKVVA